MSWQHWVLVVWFGAEVVFAAYRIGREREPLTVGGFVGTAVTYVAWAFLAVSGHY